MFLRSLLFCVIIIGCFFGVLLVPALLKSDDVGRANKYYERYDYIYAIEIYEKLMEKRPSLEVAQKLANSYRFINDTEKAEEAYAKLLTFPGVEAINYIHYGNVLKQNGNYEEAKRSYLRYAELNPAKAEEAEKLAKDCDIVKKWVDSPDPAVHIENEAQLNSDKYDFAAIPFGDKLIFASDREFIYSESDKANIYGWTGNPYLKLYTSDAIGGKVSLLPETINAKYHNGPASVSPDGKLIAFTRAGTVDDSEKQKQRKQTFKKAIYFAENSDGIWGEAFPFKYNHPFEYSLQHPAFGPAGDILYFVSDMPGGFGGMDIYYSELVSGSWSKPVNCGAIINTTEDEAFPFIREDGKLYFSSRGHITMGGMDIFSATGSKSTWSKPENLKTPFNSSKDDFGISFLKDSLSGYISSNRQGGKGMDDIYHFSLNPPAKELIFAVEGKVVEKGTHVPMPAIKIVLVNKQTGQVEERFSAQDGTFHFKLEKGKNYVVKGDIDQYVIKQKGEISTKNLSESTIFNVHFEVEKSEEAYLVRLNNIYFDLDKYSLTSRAQSELDKVTQFLKRTSDVKIELQAHTDSRGRAAYNLWLSQKRAESAMYYLLGSGIWKARLHAKGYGETQLLNECADGVQCSEAAHRLNRRIEFKIIPVKPVSAYQSSPGKSNGG